MSMLWIVVTFEFVGSEFSITSFERMGLRFWTCSELGLDL